MVSITQLSYIVAVDNFRNFAAAAKHCFVTQPTLSMQIKKLEEELGVLIFDRSCQPVIPTDIGERIIEQARNVIHEAMKIEDIIDTGRNEIAGDFRIGVIPTVAPYLLPLFIEKLMKHYPRLHLVIDEIQTHQIISKLRSEEIDAGILATPLYQSDLHERPLYYEPFIGYVSRKHRLFNKKKLRPEDLSVSDLLLLNEGHCFRGHSVQLCRDAENNSGDIPHLRFEGGNIDTLKKLVENNFGMTLLPYLALADLEGTEKMEFVRKFGSPVPKREISLVYLRAHLKIHILNILEKEIIESIPEKLTRKENSLIVS